MRTAALQNLEILLKAQAWPVPIDAGNITAWDILSASGVNELHWYDRESKFFYQGTEVRESVEVEISFSIHGVDKPTLAAAATECLERLVVALLASLNLSGSCSELQIIASDKDIGKDAALANLNLVLVFRYANND